MVKPGGGTKRKIKIEKITNKESLATSFTKRRYGLFSKISQLCLLTDAQIAVLATPLSSNSNVSFYSFGHTSVDSIVSAYLTGQRPVRVETTREHEDIGMCMARKELGLDLWFEDERLLKSSNPEQLTEAMNSMSRMLTNLEHLCTDAVSQHPADQKTLIPQSNSPTTVLLDDDDQTLTEEQDQIKQVCDSFSVPEENNNVLTGNLDQEFDIDQLIDFDFDTSILDEWCLESTNSAINNFEGSFDDGSMVSDFSDYSNGGTLKDNKQDLTWKSKRNKKKDIAYYETQILEDNAARTSLDFIEQLLSDTVVVPIFDAAVFLCSSKDAVPRMSVNTISSAESPFYDIIPVFSAVLKVLIAQRPTSRANNS